MVCVCDVLCRSPSCNAVDFDGIDCVEHGKVSVTNHPSRVETEHQLSKATFKHITECSCYGAWVERKGKEGGRVKLTSPRVHKHYPSHASVQAITPFVNHSLDTSENTG